MPCKKTSSDSFSPFTISLYRKARHTISRTHNSTCYRHLIQWFKIESIRRPIFFFYNSCNISKFFCLYGFRITKIINLAYFNMTAIGQLCLQFQPLMRVPYFLIRVSYITRKVSTTLFEYTITMSCICL